MYVNAVAVFYKHTRRSCLCGRCYYCYYIDFHCPTRAALLSTEFSRARKAIFFSSSSSSLTQLLVHTYAFTNTRARGGQARSRPRAGNCLNPSSQWTRRRRICRAAIRSALCTCQCVCVQLSRRAAIACFQCAHTLCKTLLYCNVVFFSYTYERKTVFVRFPLKRTATRASASPSDDDDRSPPPPTSLLQHHLHTAISATVPSRASKSLVRPCHIGHLAPANKNSCSVDVFTLFFLPVSSEC